MIIRVGLVCPYSLSEPGGVQGQVLGLMRSLRRLGHEVRVLAPCDGPPPDPGVTPLGRSVRADANGSVAPLAPDLPAQLRTIRALRDEGFDVVHLHEPLAPGPTMTSLLFSSAPIVGTFHAAGESASYRYLRPVVSRMAARISLRCAVSPDARSLAHRYLGGSYEVMGNGIEVDRLAAAQPWPTQGPTVLFLGRHEPRKGLEVLLAALAEMAGDVRVWVAGEGPQSEELRRRFPDERVEWLGRLDDAERDARMAGATVFCSPSVRGESFGVVLAEAMAAGTALVASDLPGHRNVATDGVDAVLTQVGDPAALADALRRVLGDQDLRASLVAAGRVRAEELSMDSLARRYVDLYRSLLPT